MSKRKAISKKTRFDIFKRDGFLCQYCGAHPPSAVLHVDHIVPVAKGGGNEDTNLTTSCDKCNLGKSATPLSIIPQSLSERASNIKEREDQLRGYSEIMSKYRERLDDDTWQVVDVYIKHFNKDGIRKDWFQSAKRFIERLGVHDCIQAMELAISKKPYYMNPCFLYFCGICWRKIKESSDV